MADNNNEGVQGNTITSLLIRVLTSKRFWLAAIALGVTALEIAGVSPVGPLSFAKGVGVL